MPLHACILYVVPCALVVHEKQRAVDLFFLLHDVSTKPNTNDRDGRRGSQLGPAIYRASQFERPRGGPKPEPDLPPRASGRRRTDPRPRSSSFSLSSSSFLLAPSPTGPRRAATWARRRARGRARKIRRDRNPVRGARAGSGRKPSASPGIPTCPSP